MKKSKKKSFQTLTFGFLVVKLFSSSLLGQVKPCLNVQISHGVYLNGVPREYYREKYHCTIDLLLDWFGLVCFVNKNINCQLSYSWFQTSQTGGEWYSDTSPFSIPWSTFWFSLRVVSLLALCISIKLDLSRTNALAYLENEEEKKVFAATPGANVIKLFTAISYEFS